MASDRRDLLDAFIELMRDECGATVSLKPDSAEFVVVLEALCKAAGKPVPPPPQPAPGAARAASASREGSG